MSLKQAQKLLKNKRKPEEEEEDLEDVDIVDQGTRKKNMFVLDDDSDEEDAYGNEEEEPKPKVPSPKAEEPAKKKKKKKNKKKKKANDDSEEEKEPPVEDKKALEYLDKVIEENKAQCEEFQKEYTQMLMKEGLVAGSKPSILEMDRKFFSYKREMNQLFAKQTAQFGGAEEEKKEDRRGQIDEQMEAELEGASKRQRKLYKQKYSRMMAEQTRAMAQRKFMFVQPEQNWPRPPANFLSMEVVGQKENGSRIFSFKKSPGYQSLQKEFAQVQATMDIGLLFRFLQKNFYHHESLLNFADFLRLQGKFTEAFEFLERCLFAFEYAFIFEFQPFPSAKSLELLSTQNHSFFLPQVELDQSSGSEPLNTIFGDCLVKYVDVLGRKGCSRTALEFCKLLLGLNPKQDTHGVLLRFDYYAVRAKEYEYLIDFVELFSQEVFLQNDSQISNIKLLPNLLMATSLCKRNLASAEGSSHNESIEAALMRLKKAVEEGAVQSLFDNSRTMESAAMGVILCLLIYPPMVSKLIERVGKKQISQTFKKSFYKGYQTMSWKNILKHEIFEEGFDSLAYDWIVPQSEKDLVESEEKVTSLVEESAQKVINIAVERSSPLYTDDEVLLWLREIIGLTLNFIDDGALPDRQLLLAQLQSGIVSEKFSWSRYRLSLKTADFMDDLSIVAPQDLLMGGQQPPVEPMGGDIIDDEANQAQNQAQQQMAEAQINQMIHQLQQPVNPMAGGQGMQQQQQQVLIEEGGAEGMTQEEFEQLQAALVASMNEEEEIHIGEEEEGQQAAGGGLIQGMMNMMGFGGNQQQDDPERDREDQ